MPSFENLRWAEITPQDNPSHPLANCRSWTSRCHEAIAVRRVGVLEGMTPMQFSRFGAVSSRSGPWIREVCIEAISLRASGRCILPQITDGVSDRHTGNTHTLGNLSSVRHCPRLVHEAVRHRRVVALGAICLGLSSLLHEAKPLIAIGGGDECRLNFRNSFSH